MIRQGKKGKKGKKEKKQERISKCGGFSIPDWQDTVSALRTTNN
jgi:hypothetical protein